MTSSATAVRLPQSRHAWGPSRPANCPPARPDPPAMHSERIGGGNRGWRECAARGGTSQPDALPVRRRHGPLGRPRGLRGPRRPREAAHPDRRAAPPLSVADPDGNPLAYRWWRYNDVDSATSRLDILDATTPTARLLVPEEPGRPLHLILALTDRGHRPLTRYQRLILTIVR